MFCDVLTFSIICNMDFLANGNLDIAFCSVADIRCTKFGFYKIQIFFFVYKFATNYIFTIDFATEKGTGQKSCD